MLCLLLPALPLSSLLLLLFPVLALPLFLTSLSSLLAPLFPIVISFRFVVLLLLLPGIAFLPLSMLYVPLPDDIDILNPDQTETITVESVMCSSRHFQLSSFQPTSLPPLSRIQVPIVFLPRQQG